MIKISEIEVWGFKGAIRGMRNPLNSWDKSDSESVWYPTYSEPVFEIGNNDLNLMKRLHDGGPVHAKYLRMIHIQLDCCAPLYWWKEADTYRIGVTRNSCSTMHKIHAKPFTEEDFSIENLTDIYRETMLKVITQLNGAREEYLEAVEEMNLGRTPESFKELSAKAKGKWWQMIQLLPSSYNQKATLDFNYQVALEMIRWREFHKLDEWREFVKVLKTLPYMEELLKK